jgi:polyhydroxyalkanoic acid synthase PhaR subunit
VSDSAPPPEDPLRPMREAYEQAVEGWSKAMEQMVASEEFASASGEFLKRYVEMQESLRTASQAAAESVHFPTTDDLARLAQLVINVERKVDEVSDEAHAIAGRLAAIEAALDELARRAAGTPDPPTTPTAKRAPARRRGKPSAAG